MGANLDNITRIKNDAINGPADGTLTLTNEAKAGYIAAITDLRNTINDQIGKLNGLPGYGDPGAFNSAIKAKQNLINGCNEFKTYMGDYVKYLDAMIDTINAVSNRMLNAG